MQNDFGNISMRTLLYVVDIQETSDGLNHLHSILSTLPQAVIGVMRYLFAFLNQYVPLKLLYH